MSYSLPSRVLACPSSVGPSLSGSTMRHAILLFLDIYLCCSAAAFLLSSHVELGTEKRPQSCMQHWRSYLLAFIKKY
jgi:hypothetical protein